MRTNRQIRAVKKIAKLADKLFGKETPVLVNYPQSGGNFDGAVFISRMNKSAVYGGVK